MVEPHSRDGHAEPGQMSLLDYERDYVALKAAADSGRIEVQTGL